MAKAGRKPSGREVVQCRIDPGNIAKLDELADKIKPRPSRSLMVDLAVAEYIERHYGKKSKER